jgi:hypothetical protein
MVEDWHMPLMFLPKLADSADLWKFQRFRSQLSLDEIVMGSSGWASAIAHLHVGISGKPFPHRPAKSYTAPSTSQLFSVIV